MTWTYDPAALKELLEDAGFDVDASDAELPGGGGSLTGKRGRGNRATTVVVDAGGRVRVTEAARREGGRTLRATAGGVELKVTEETTRKRTATGTVASLAQVEALLRAAAAGLASLPAADEGGADEASGEAGESSADLPSWARRVRRKGNG
jgi:hypothetical protein